MAVFLLTPAIQRGNIIHMMNVEQLRLLRQRHGISVEQVASDLGYDRTTVWRWERNGGPGSRQPHKLILKAWRIALESRIATQSEEA